MLHIFKSAGPLFLIKNPSGETFNAVARLILVSIYVPMPHDQYFPEEWCVLIHFRIIAISISKNIVKKVEVK